MIAASSFVEIDELVHRTAAQGRARSTKEQFCDTIDCVDLEANDGRWPNLSSGFVGIIGLQFEA